MNVLVYIVGTVLEFFSFLSMCSYSYTQVFELHTVRALVCETVIGLVWGHPAVQD